MTEKSSMCLWPTSSDCCKATCFGACVLNRVRIFPGLVKFEAAANAIVPAVREFVDNTAGYRQLLECFARLFVLHLACSNLPLFVLVVANATILVCWHCLW